MEHLDFVIWTIGWLWLILKLEPASKSNKDVIAYFIFKAFGLIFWAYIGIKLFLNVDPHPMFIDQYKWYNC